ncbi:MAG: carbonic anhydrase [Sandaracinaceae bacterium]|nr:carbonic anhydrase [Sandaracinaceae bacterium]
MQRSYEKLLENNRRWVERKRATDPEVFTRLSTGQQPRFLFIGCCDSRVPANEITDTGPGEMFVVRNVANQVVPTDLGAASAVTYALKALEVQHIIVCGHYGCGGVDAALAGGTEGILDFWLGHVRQIARQNGDELERLPDQATRARRLVELNVQAQLDHLKDLSVVREALDAGRVMLHGWVYDLRDGLLRPLAEEPA